MLLYNTIILHGLNTNLEIIIFLVLVVFVQFRFLTQPNDKTSPEKSPEGSPKLRYGATRHKTQPITPEEKREAEGGQSSEVKVSVRDRYKVNVSCINVIVPVISVFKDRYRGDKYQLSISVVKDWYRVYQYQSSISI